ncbi:MAG TPA: metallophosphoesterase [Methanosarcinales archaeon]|nr:metallophosphoesterase [Methanosarcinales archaeon]
MSIYVTGDKHGEIDMKRISGRFWPQGRKTTEKDYLIILGDFGLIWNGVPDGIEAYWKVWLQNKPWTTLFIDGNHENHYRLNRLEKVRKFGGIVGRYSDKIFHLRRGQIYEIEGKKIFTFGGAVSIDKYLRTPDISWWKEEVASTTEMNEGMDNLEKHGNKVDYIMSHTAPAEAVDILLSSMGNNRFQDINDPTEKYLDMVVKTCEFKELYCGHWHEDIDLGRYHFLYFDVKKIT